MCRGGERCGEKNIVVRGFSQPGALEWPQYERVWGVERRTETEIESGEPHPKV